jgi:MFS family permease
VAVIAQIGISFIDQGIPLLAGFIKDDLALSAAGIGLVVSAFSFGRIFGSYAAGIAADRLGERRVIVAGGTAVAVLTALAALSPTPVFLTLLVLAGVAGAVSTPAGGRLVLLAFPPSRAGIALGIRQTGIPIAGLLAAVLLPWVAHLASWRWSLALAAGLTVACLAPLTLTRVTRFDDRLEPVSSNVTPDRRERNRNVALLTLWGCLLVTGQYALLTFLALDIVGRTGITLAAASAFVALANAAGIAGRVGWGWASDNHLHAGRKPLLLLLTLAALTAALALLLLPASAPTAVFVAVAFMAGLSLLGYQGLWVVMIADAVGPDRVGRATGFSITFVTASIAASPPLYGLAADVAGTYRAVWGALAVVIAIAFVPALLLRERVSEAGAARDVVAATRRTS